jgi:hypothetical protein
MEEVFEMYAEDEEDALKQVAEEDPDCMLKNKIHLLNLILKLKE